MNRFLFWGNALSLLIMIILFIDDQRPIHFLVGLLNVAAMVRLSTAKDGVR